MKISNVNDLPDNSSGSATLIEVAKPEIASQQDKLSLPADKPFDFTQRDIFGRIALACSALTASMGIIGIIILLSGFRQVVRLGPNYIPMSRIIPLMFILLGSAWFFYVFNPNRRLSKICALTSAIFISSIAFLSLIRFLTGVQIEEPLYRILAINPEAPMSPITSAGFLFNCIAMILLLLRPLRRIAGVSGSLSFIVISINLAILLGYLYGAPVLYGGAIRPVALPVAATFVVLSVGIIATAGPAHSLLRHIIGPSVRALLLRYFLLVIYIVALIDSIFYNISSNYLKHKLAEPEIQALSAFIYVITATVVVLKLSQIIGGALYRSETARKQAEDINEQLQREISSRKRAEEELKHRMAELAQSNAELEQYAYVASHDLQEPLRMITSFTQLLEKRYKGRLDNDADEFIGYVVDGATRMQRMINDLLAYSRIGLKVKPIEPIDCEAVLDQALDNLKIIIQESRAVVTHDNLPTVMADASQMVTVFQNLLSNAIKFRRGTPHIRISARQKRNEWIFSVRDNGIGINPESIEHLFVLFHRLHSRDAYPGTGIGLATCKKIVERQGGRIWVESKLGRGSTFYFTIPAKRDE